MAAKQEDGVLLLPSTGSIRERFVTSPESHLVGVSVWEPLAQRQWIKSLDTVSSLRRRCSSGSQGLTGEAVTQGDRRGRSWALQEAGAGLRAQQAGLALLSPLPGPGQSWRESALLVLGSL